MTPTVEFVPGVASKAPTLVLAVTVAAVLLVWVRAGRRVRMGATSGWWIAMLALVPSVLVPGMLTSAGRLGR